MTIKLVLFVAVVFVAQEALVGTAENLNLLAKTITVKAIKNYMQNYAFMDFSRCLKEQSENFEKFGEHLFDMTYEVIGELSESAVGEELERLVENATEPMTTMAFAVEKFPQNLWDFVKEQKFDEALQYRQNVERTVEQCAKEFAEILEKVRVKESAVAEKVDKKIVEINKKAKKKGKTLNDAIKKCMEKLPKNSQKN